LLVGIWSADEDMTIAWPIFAINATVLFRRHPLHFSGSGGKIVEPPPWRWVNTPKEPPLQRPTWLVALDRFGGLVVVLLWMAIVFAMDRPIEPP